MLVSTCAHAGTRHVHHTDPGSPSSPRCARATAASPCSIAATSCRARSGATRRTPRATFRRRVQAHLDRDLSSRSPPTSGRHPLPDVTKLRGNARRVGYRQHRAGGGVRPGKRRVRRARVVAAALAGAQRVAVLDGGFAAWQEAGLPMSREPGRARRARVHAAPRQRRGALDGRGAAGARARETSRSSTRAARTASPARTKRSIPWPATCPAPRNRPFAQERGRARPLLPPAELRRQWRARARHRRRRGRRRDVRLRRQRVPQPARAGDRRAARRASLPRLVERVDPRPRAPGRAGPR